MNWISESIMNPYLKICRDAVSDDQVFAAFKSHPDYTKVLEHTSYRQGEEYFSLINKQWLSEYNFITNDRYGGPNLQVYDQWAVSPTTLQYIYVLSRLVELCGSLDDMNIIEIGGGYGGQCKIIYDMFRPKSYTIMDLPAVCRLQYKYLSKFGITINSMPPNGPTLFMSNYALSELTEQGQGKDISAALVCEHGYITCNGPIYRIEELRKLPGFKISPDIKTERKTNFVITW